MQPLTFIKLGGSLITNKNEPEALLQPVIEQIAEELSEFRQRFPQMRLVIGHGAGSFGHLYAHKYGTRRGVRTAEEWFGFALTSDAVARLNRQVTTVLLAAGIPAWSIQPSIMLRCCDGQIIAGPTETVMAALERGLVPVLHGDFALGEIRGGTIASTEEIFSHLVEQMAATYRIERMLLLGRTDGIFTSNPTHWLEPESLPESGVRFGPNRQTRLIPQITPGNYRAWQNAFGRSHGIDVTGGMASKVAESLDLVRRYPLLRIVICSGLRKGNLLSALCAPSAVAGTLIYNDLQQSDSQNLDSQEPK